MVREHEFLVVKNLLDGENSLTRIEKNVRNEISDFKHEQLEQALRFLEDGGAVKIKADNEIRPSFSFK